MSQIISKQTTATNEIWKVRSNVITKSNPKMAVEDENGELLVNKEEILKRHNEYYKSLLTTREPDPIVENLNREIDKQFKINMKNNINDSEFINSLFTEAELDCVIKKLKTRKCLTGFGMKKKYQRSY